MGFSDAVDLNIERLMKKFIERWAMVIIGVIGL